MEKLVSLSPFSLSMLKDDLKLSSSEDSDGEQVCSLNHLPKKHLTHPWGSPGQGAVAQQQTGQLSRRSGELKSRGMVLDKPQIFLNVMLGKILCRQIEMLCFVETVCFYLGILIN